MSDVEKAIKGNPHDDADDNNASRNDENELHQQQQQHQQQQHHHHEHRALKSTSTTGATGADIVVASTNKVSCTQRALGHFLKIVCSTPGLVLLVIGYSVLGALIFPLLEAPQDLSKSAAIAKSREDCLRELWIITEKLNVLYERNWTMLVHEQLRRFEGSIVAATRQGGGAQAGAGSFGAAAATSNALGHFGYDAASNLGEHWTFSEALLYSVTVITTIGHGSLTPRTAAGKIATIFYALIGVPLMLMCLSSLGALLAEALQCTYVRLCCQLQRIQGGDKMAATPTVNKRRQATANGANCKNCKYDAANTETSLNDCYDFGGQATAMALTKRKLSLEQGEQEACQLLRNATPPSKLNQQQPDVMLMTTTAAAAAAAAAAAGGATSGNALLKYAMPQSHALHYINATQQQQLSTATLPRVHHQHSQHPQQQQQQLQQHQHQQQHQQQQQQQRQQNFVAVPSSMLRFTASTATPTPPNCYAPATATIYFPFTPALGGSPAHGGQQTAAAVAAAAATNSVCQQPLVKYHTIHLQPATSKRLLTTLEPVVTLSTAGVAAAGAAGAAGECATTAAAVSTLETITLPPPPAYQTANVHAVRRAKFVTNPLPPEINTLLSRGGGGGDAATSDISCRHDLLLPTTPATGMATPPLLSYTAAANVTAAATATSPQLSAGIKTTTAMADSSFIAAGVCGAMTSATATATAAGSSGNGGGGAGGAGGVVGAGGAAATLSTFLSTSGHVDIMEDEDEQERERLSCSHGTPSRVPLIAAGSGALNLPHNSPLAAEKSHSHARGLLNATAASFHRHTLQPLNRKTLLLTRRCQKHATGTTIYDSTATTETSDDEEYMQHGSEQFVLKKLNQNICNASDTDDCDGREEDQDQEDYELQQLGAQQVPISIVLLILMCYICVGTVIFALWENWSLVDGAYFCFVTLSTIGYGDFVPTRSFNGPEVQLYACCAYLLLGLVLVAMSFSILETQLMWKCKRIAVRLKLAKD